jgi:hypothetical protein
MSETLPFEGQRQAFINGQEYGRDQAVRLWQVLIAGVAQQAERQGDIPKFQAASEIAKLLFDCNWGLNGEKPAMPAIAEAGRTA